MRKFKNLLKAQQNDLLAMFPDIEKVIAVEETNTYKFLAISVFDRWLNQEDGIRLLSNVPPEEQAERDAKLNSFSERLIQETELINFTIKGRWSKSRISFREFLSINAKQAYMSKAPSDVGSNFFFKVAIPELEALYFESWDDTNVFYLRDEKTADLIESWARSCGLYCLSKW